MIFRFKDGSVFDETVVFTQQRVFTMQSYRLVHRGPVFAEDTEISLERASGKYRVKTKARKDGQEKALDGALDLPPDVYNGMVLTVVKNLAKGPNEIVQIVAFTPTPRLIKLELAPMGEHKVLVGELAKTASHYRVEAPARDLAQAFRHTARAHAAGLSRLGPHGRGASVREVRGPTLHGRADLGERGDEPPLARVAALEPGKLLFDLLSVSCRRHSGITLSL